MLTFQANSRCTYIYTVLLLVLGLLFANAAHALGMGKIKVYSYLDEPLVAEIELIGTSGLDPYQLIVKLASAQDFARSGLERPYFLNNIDFEILFYNGNGYIFMRSVKPVQVPYLEFLVELSWPEGSLVKDYTILIDPPPPNLSKENRPLAYGQLAQIEAQQRAFGTDVIESQLSEQELMGSGARVLTPKKTDQKSFSDEDVQVVTTDTGAVTIAETTELIPEVVPDVTEEVLEDGPAFPNKGSDTEVIIQETEAADNKKFAKQLTEFENKQQEKFSQPKRKSWVGSLAPAEKVLPEEAPKKSKSTKPQFSKQQPTVVEEQPATPEQIQQEISAESSSMPGSEPEEEIDFSTVIEPVAPEQPKAETTTAEASVSKQLGGSVDTPASVAPAEEGSSIILPLIITVLLVVILVAGGLVAKKYILNKKADRAEEKDPHAGSDQREQYAWDDEDELENEFEVVESVVAKPVESNADQAEVAAVIVEQPSQEQIPSEPSPKAVDATNKPASEIDTLVEDIELAAPPPKQDTPEDLAAVEAELVNLDLQTISPDPEIKLVDDEANVAPEIPVAGKEAPNLFPEPEIEFDSSLKLAPEVDSAEDESPEVEKNSKIESLSAMPVDLRDPDIDMKLDLARKYIDAGDKESAKSLLLEAQDLAKDEQKVEIEMLLSTLQ